MFPAMAGRGVRNMSWDLAFYKRQRQVNTTEGDVLVCQEFSNYLMNHATGDKRKSEVGTHKIKGDGKSGTGFSQDYFFIRYG